MLAEYAILDPKPCIGGSGALVVRFENVGMRYGIGEEVLKDMPQIALVSCFRKHTA